MWESMFLDLYTASLEDPRVVYALIRLRAEDGPSPRGHVPARRPVNLALVLDRSSSMRGPRLSQAVLAVRRLVERLDARDRLAVVTFDAAVRVLLPAGPVTDEARARLTAELDRLDTGAGTNLAAGWRKGCELVASGFVREAVSRVILLTDGLPSVGVRDPEKLAIIAEGEAARGVSTTTMGIGEGFDDELLGEISRRGRGGFYYLANPEAIPAAFGRELAGVFAIAATGVELKVLPEANISSCEVLHRLVTRTTAEGLFIEIGEIAQASPRQVLLRMVRSDTDHGRLLAKLAVTYRDASGNESSSHLDRLAMATAPNPSEVAEITMERLRLASATALDEAWARRASGHRDQALAALAEVRSAIAGARERKLAPAADLDHLAQELAQAEQALAGAVKEAERYRRAARERSHVTLLGQSVVKPLLPDDD
jgi:Ca-activated chloride channel family protein